MVARRRGRGRAGEKTQDRHDAGPAGTAINAASVLFRGAETCEGLLDLYLPFYQLQESNTELYGEI